AAEDPGLPILEDVRVLVANVELDRLAFSDEELDVSRRCAEEANGIFEALVPADDHQAIVARGESLERELVVGDARSIHLSGREVRQIEEFAAMPSSHAAADGLVARAPGNDDVSELVRAAPDRRGELVAIEAALQDHGARTDAQPGGGEETAVGGSPL